MATSSPPTLLAGIVHAVACAVLARRGPGSLLLAAPWSAPALAALIVAVGFLALAPPLPARLGRPACCAPLGCAAVAGPAEPSRST